MRQTRRELEKALEMSETAKRELEQRQRATTMASQPRPAIPDDVRVATLAVVMILEQHAEVMAVKQGGDVAAYQDAITRARALRKAIEESEWASGVADIEDEARALYAELTS